MAKNTYYSDVLYGVLLAVSKKEYPKIEDAVSKVIREGVRNHVVQLADKHKVTVPAKLRKPEAERERHGKKN